MRAIKIYTTLDQEISIKQINDEQVVLEVNNLPVIVLSNDELIGLSNACEQIYEVINNDNC